MFMGAPEDYEMAEKLRMLEILEAYGQDKGALTWRDESTYDINEFEEGEDGMILIQQALIDAMDEFDRGRPAFLQTERSRREPDRLYEGGGMDVVVDALMAPSGSPRRRF